MRRWWVAVLLTSIVICTGLATGCKEESGYRCRGEVDVAGDGRTFNRLEVTQNKTSAQRTATTGACEGLCESRHPSSTSEKERSRLDRKAERARRSCQRKCKVIGKVHCEKDSTWKFGF